MAIKKQVGNKTVVISGNKDLAKRLGRIPELSRSEILLNAVKASMMTMRNDASNNLKRNKNVISGTLRRALRVSAKQRKERIIGEVGTNLFYAPFVEFGRGPVKPVKKKFLKWWDRKRKKWVFAKSSGPMAPSPFLRPAFEKNKNKVTDDIFKFINQQLNKIL